MDIRQAKKDDSTRISALAIALTEKYLVSEFPESAGKELLMSMSPEAIAGNMATGFEYHVAVVDDEIVAFIGIKSNSHLYHLFVSEFHQRKGIARSLWETAKSKCYKNGNLDKITVNSSLYAKPVYEKLGFVTSSDIQVRNGIKSIAMEFVFNK